jgi:hypothetical protein
MRCSSQGPLSSGQNGVTAPSGPSPTAAQCATPKRLANHSTMKSQLIETIAVVTPRSCRSRKASSTPGARPAVASACHRSASGMVSQGATRRRICSGDSPRM